MTESTLPPAVQALIDRQEILACELRYCSGVDRFLNHRCELDGDLAHAETYWLFAGRNTFAPAISLHGGRYLDRLEKRGAFVLPF
jgi:hypothetical protein